MSAIRGVLLAGRFRSHHELIQMSHDDQRNTLIVELDGRTNQAAGRLSGSRHRLQGFTDDQLAGLGAVYVFLRAARIRSEAELRNMDDDALRNTLIVEIAAQPASRAALQALDNLSLVLEGLCQRVFQGDVEWPRMYVRGCLVAGGFRSHHALNEMSAEDQRNTLIVEMATRFAQGQGNLSASNVPRLQAMDNAELSGLAGAYLFLRDGGIRSEEQLRSMSTEDIRNTLIVEVDGQLHLGGALQAYSTLDLVRLGLGLEPQDRISSGVLHPPVHHPRMLQFRLRGFSEHESTDDFLQGARDEVHFDALGVASTKIMSDPITFDVALAPIGGNRIGDVSNDDVRGGWAQNPHVLLEFNLDSPGNRPEYPRTYVATVLAVEHDNQGLSEMFLQLKDIVGEETAEAIKGLAAAGGSYLGNAALPGWGAILGAAAGALAGEAWDEIIGAINQGLADETFAPRVQQIGFNHDLDWPNLLDKPQTLHFWEHGANYTLEYDWHIHVA